jgi:rare lipoprotein A (peptidoglycan hydrolase)
MATCAATCIGAGCCPRPGHDPVLQGCPPCPCQVTGQPETSTGAGETATLEPHQPTGARAMPAGGDRDSQSSLQRRFAAAPALAVLTGQAAYYSDSLAGRPTASGEIYDPRAFTAAHRTLPFGTVLRVVSVAGGPSVYVRVNDRGPFGDAARVVDLSRAAAERLGMLRAGVIPVRIEVVDYGSAR